MKSLRTTWRTATLLLIVLNLGLAVAQVVQARSGPEIWWRSCCRGDGASAYCCIDCCLSWGLECRFDSDCEDR